MFNFEVEICGTPAAPSKGIIIMNNTDFRNYAVHHRGMNGLALDQYTAMVNSTAPVASYINPTINNQIISPLTIISICIHFKGGILLCF